MVYPHDDPTLVPMELGASIFVKANKNLWRATDEFNLTRTGFAADENDETGIWDGEDFVLRLGDGSGMIGNWWNSLKVVWRYGYKAPTKTQAMYVPAANPLCVHLTDEVSCWRSVWVI